MEPIYSFGEWLGGRRKALDLTRAELAQRAGCSVGALRKIEADERRPSKQLAGLLADSLAVPPDERLAFIKAARGELRVDRLGPPSLLGLPERVPPTTPFKAPIPPTPLIGRAPELVELGQLLRDPHCRLLTVVGPGGIGKTHLALELASRQRDFFCDGIYFVSLAALNSRAFLVPAIADALGLAFQGQIEPRAQLLDYLRTKQALLVLDNVEHLLEGVGLFAEILQHAPGVKSLMTSRERLNLQGEWVFELQGLSVPPADKVQDAQGYSAVTLFIQSARRVQMGFEIQSEEQAAVVRICRLVDGMPLGIEMAAAWVRSMSCREIADEISRNLDFLTTTMRDVPERHRSLRAIFEQTWERLTTAEREVLAKLSVFRGGCSREAAETVAGATLPLLASLAGRSLLRRTESGYYELHDLIRQFAASQLGADSGYRQQLQDRHCAYYASFVEQRMRTLEGDQQRVALAEIAAEIDNVRAGWQHALSCKQLDSLRAFHSGLGRFYWLRGRFEEARNAFQAAVTALAREAPPTPACQELLVGILTSYSAHSQFLGQMEPAEAALEKALALAERLDRPALLAAVLDRQARLNTEQGDYVRARALGEKALSIYRALGDDAKVATMLLHQGLVNRYLQEYGTAQSQLDAGLAIHQRMNNLPEMMLGLGYLAQVLIRVGAYAEAQDYLQQVVAICKQLNTPVHTSAYNNLGQVAEARGDYELAQQHFRASLAYCERVHNEVRSGTPLAYLGNLARIQGDYDEAARRLHKSLDIHRRYHCVREIALDFYLLGLLAQALDDHATAAEKFESSYTLYEADENRRGMALALHGLGQAALAHGEWERTPGYFRSALGLSTEIGAHPVTLQVLCGWASYLLAKGETEEGLGLAAFVAAQPSTYHEIRLRAHALCAGRAAALSISDRAQLERRTNSVALADMVARHLNVAMTNVGGRTWHI